MSNNINKFNYVSNKKYEISDCNISYKAFLSLVKAQDGDTIYVDYKGKDIKGAFIYEFYNPKRAFWDRAFIHFTTKDDENAVKWVSNYFCSNNITVSVEEAVQMAKNGEIKDVTVSLRNGEEFLRSYPDGDDSNNLRDLPHHREY